MDSDTCAAVLVTRLDGADGNNSRCVLGHTHGIAVPVSVSGSVVRFRARSGSGALGEQFPHENLLLVSSRAPHPHDLAQLCSRSHPGLGLASSDHIADPVGDTRGKKNTADRFMKRSYALTALVTGSLSTVLVESTCWRSMA
jgi:hypothetical protein